MSQLCVLFEHAAGYALFKATTEDVDEIKAAVIQLANFQNIVVLVSFQPFKTGKDALENMNCVSEGLLHPTLEVFLTNHMPKSKKKRPVVLGVSEAKLVSAISEKLEIQCSAANYVAELIRGIRFHFHNLVEGFSSQGDAIKSQLGLGHHYSRARVKFNVNRIDNMIIQSISLLDQLDKDINTFTMRVREWYSHHFPELIKVVPDNATFIQCLMVVKDRKELSEDCTQQLEEILQDPVKVEKVMEVASSSMGMDISELDLCNVYLFAERVTALTERRKQLCQYLRAKMQSIAPNLAALIGDMVGARLIAHAGSLINLAKYPASTVQILGAEKALFRAIKTKGNTPKYGIIFHSKFIGKAAKSNKGRISRYLANKCSVASRIDCFRDIPTDVFGLKLREQVESRLKFYETGELPPKNVDVMDIAMEEAEVAEASILKEMKKKNKKKKRKSGDESMNVSQSEVDQSMVDEEAETPKKKKKKNKLNESAAENGPAENGNEEEEVVTPKKKKKKMSMDVSMSESLNESLGNGLGDSSGKKKKKKKKKHNDEEEEEE